MNFDFTPSERRRLWASLVESIEKYYAETECLKVSPNPQAKPVQSFIADFTTLYHHDAQAVLDHVIKGLTEFTVHTPHPSYFGLFNPRANFPGILADTITAVFNPQLAAWTHAPFATGTEQFLINFFGEKFGYLQPDIDGVFTTGGSEANLTAILCALTTAFPRYANEGVRSCEASPVIYCSAESHHSILKSARIAGLGSNSVKIVPVNGNLEMDTAMLVKQIREDLKAKLYPLMVVATAGTTGAGVIDPLLEIVKITKRNKIWLHVDAAYGGGLVLSSKFSLLRGIEKADSITFDAHKWLSVPMGTSMFLTHHKNVLSRTFHTSTAYMPNEPGDNDMTDPYMHSMQWSRRFNGLKLYMALFMIGEKQYRRTLDHQIRLGGFLKQQLIAGGWQILNKTELPIVCFGKPTFKLNTSQARQITDKIIQSGTAWISVYPIDGVPAIRACITNYNTSKADILRLIKEVDLAYHSLSATK